MSGTLPQENSYVHGSVTNIFTEEDFNDLEEIATGGEAICFRAFSPRFGEVCTKIFHSPAMKTGLKKELEIFLKHSDHPNLIRFFGFYENNYRKSERIGYVMEYMPGGSLHDIIYSHERYTFANACNWMAQAARGLDYLHRARIIHRDVKPKNMLLDRHRETLKLSDFGLAKTLDHTTFDSKLVTILPNV